MPSRGVAMAIDADFATETTTDPDYADKQGFYKVELWAKNHMHVRPAAARQQPYRQGDRICRSDQAPATWQVHHPPADACG